MNEKEILIEKIMNKLNEFNIMEFIKEEVSNSLVYINKYKLKNIYDNINNFVEDILKVNQSYIDGLKKI